jgi:hypothetical protein
MPTITAPTILKDPGYLFCTPITTVVPTMVAAGSKFTDAWPAAWLPMGATEDGNTFNYQTNVEAITVAEFLDPIMYSTTSRAGSFAFNLAHYTLQNWFRALNMGAGSLTGLTADSGTGATAIYSLSPPDPGAEVRVQLGWESFDNTLRFICYQTLNGGQIQSAFKKAPDKAVIPCTFNFEIPTGLTKPFKMFGTQTRNV